MDFFPLSTLSASSKTLFSKKLEAWISLLPRGTLLKLICDPEQSIKALEEAPDITHSNANHHIFLSAVIALLKHEKPKGTTIKERADLLSRWLPYQKSNSKPLFDHYLEEKPTAKQEGKNISLSEIIACRDKLPAGPERLLFGFYTHLDPVRADYFETEIVREGETPTSANYIVMGSKARIVLTDFKTKKTYEKIEQELPAVLRSELEADLAARPRRYLFKKPDSPLEPFDRNGFSGWGCRTLTRHLGTPMTLTALRHIYISERGDRGLKELDRMAKNMGHGLSMQRGYKWEKKEGDK